MPLPRDLDPAAAHALRAADSRVVYLDVRSSFEFAEGHPPGAVNLPLAEFDPTRGMTPNPNFLEVARRRFPLETPLLLGCASGGRSKQAQMLLAGAGYADLCNVLGGFRGGMGPTGPVPGWAACGLPVGRDGTTYADLLKALGL
jgi:rhodanese-related sulfurtransferase